ncbi:MAG: M12 family metallo-peptidase [Saprospiraceae bacterium]
MNTRINRLLSLLNIPFSGFIATILICILTMSPFIESNSQNQSETLLLEKLKNKEFKKLSLGHSLIKDSNKQTNQLSLSLNEFANWQQNETSVVETSALIADEESLTLQLIPYDFFESNFKCLLDNQSELTEINIDRGIHYKGIVNNNINSMIGISIFEEGIEGLINTEDQRQFTLRTISKTNSSLILQLDAIQNSRELNCSTDDWEHYIQTEPLLQSRTKENCKRTQISVRADYQLYLKFNKNPQLVSNYITGLFNHINTIYRREDIQISLSEIIINTVPDGFTHTSSNGDLNYLKSKYKSFNGNIHLCLSGFTRSGKATLGGVSYINSLCLKTYAYAFANVEGNYTDLPNYSYDVFMAAHELGHVFGSRHTHACVWGPNKNQALDNCGPQEGSCAAGPKPTKGTLMSYCHLSGKPGTDLMLGFGKEPGDLIRSIVNNASCLSLYSPNSSNIQKANQHLSANVECSDGVYSNYYFDNNTIDEKDDILIASIKKNGQDIGNLQDGSLSIIAHTTKDFGSGKAQDVSVSYASKNTILANRFWEINSNITLAKEINVRVNFGLSDIKEIQAIQSSASLEKLNFYTVSAPANANPELKHISVDKKSYLEYKMGTQANSLQWKLTKINDQTYSAEFSTKILNDIGLAYNRSSNLDGKISSRENGSSDSNLQIYPNPIEGDELTLDYFNNTDRSFDAHIEIFNTKLQSVYAQETNLNSGTNKIILPTTGLSNGVYFLRIQTESEIKTIPIIVAKN